MTLDDVLQELIQHLDSQGDGTIAWEQVREWPKGAVSIFQESGWIKTKAPAKSVVCPGCEENCFMPVHVSPAMQGQPTKAYVACDRRDDMGRIPISQELYQQWQITEYQVARWIHKTLGLKGQPKKDPKAMTIRIGTLQGRKVLGDLNLSTTPPISFQASGNSIPFGDVAYMKDQQPSIEVSALKRLVDRSENLKSAKARKPSDVKREARKIKTQEMYKSWQKEYRYLKNQNPDKSDRWCADQIADSPVGKGRSPDTIRRNMKC